MAKRDNKNDSAEPTRTTINNVRSGVRTVDRPSVQTSNRGVYNTTQRIEVQTPSVDRWGGYNVTEDGVAKSLVGGERSDYTSGYLGNPGVSDTPRTAPDSVVVTPGGTPPPTGRTPQKNRTGFLKVDVPTTSLRDTTKPKDTKSPFPRSDIKPRDEKKDILRCHPRPESNKPRDPAKGGGGGSPRAEKKWRGHWC